MGYFDDIRGNHDAKERIGRLIFSHTLPHALMLEGPSGSGKTYFAKRIAAALMCECKAEKRENNLPCMNCKACRHVLSEIAPDVHYLDRGDNASIGVKHIRDFRQEMRLSSVESEARVFIIKDAHLMTLEAQNALLTILEEPPQGVYILLLCERREALLTTIRSRAQSVRMELLSKEDLLAFAETQPPLQKLRQSKPDLFMEAILACGGCAGKFMQLANREEMSTLEKQRKAVYKLLDTLASGATYQSISDAIKGFSSKRKELTEELALLLLAIRDLIVLEKAESPALLFYVDQTYATELSGLFGKRRLHRLYDTIYESRESVQSNANVTLAQSTLVLALLSA